MVDYVSVWEIEEELKRSIPRKDCHRMARILRSRCPGKRRKLLREIAASMEISAPRVRQIEQEGLRILQHGTHCLWRERTRAHDPVLIAWIEGGYPSKIELVLTEE